MKTENLIQSLSYAFALRSIQVYKVLQSRKEYVLSKQFLRCSTSIGANIEEGIGGQSKADFIAKLSIAYKEAREAHYWIRLLTDSQILHQKEGESLLADVESILKVLSRILQTSKSNKNP